MKTKYKSNRGRNVRNNKSKNKRKYKIDKSKPYGLYIILVIIIMFGLYKSAPEVIQFNITMSEEQEDKIRQVVREEVYEVLQEMEVQQDTQQNIIQEQPIEVTSRSSVERQPVEQPVEDKTLNNYRITSYYPGDGYQTTSKTGSGKTVSDFSTMKIGNKSVYTYQGKIVVAGATKELLKSGYSKNGAQNNQVKHYFSYNDTGKVKIDGNWYEFIVLDSCGASMWEHYYRLDIFVPSASDVININSTDIIYY